MPWRKRKKTIENPPPKASDRPKPLEKQQSDDEDGSDDAEKVQPVLAKPVEKKRSRTSIVIGIDFGTTYSGGAFSILHPHDEAAEARISVVRNWEGELPGNTTSNKVPTVLAYDESANVHWGFNIPYEYTHKAIRWVKLLLEPNLQLRDNDAIDLSEPQKILEESGRTAVQAASDFLKCLWNHIREQIIIEHSEAIFDFADKSIVLTVPAVWSEAAKHNTFLVASGAGLVTEKYKLQIVSEPEAAAIAVLRERARRLRKNDCYVVVDAGGGTVDLTSYRLESTSPLELEELVVGDGDLCGAVFLDQSFKNLLRTYLNADTYDALPPENLARIMNDFETGVRKQFDGEDKIKYSVTMPGIADDPTKKIQAGFLRLSAAELKPVFHTVVDKTERLVRKQINALGKKGYVPKAWLHAILLVGGFGTNRYLAQRLKQSYERPKPEDQEFRKIEVLQPNIGWDSIANGAVRCEAQGLGGLVSLRVARASVGIVAHEWWDKDIHLSIHKYRNPFDREWWAKDQVAWSVRRNDRMRPGHRVSFQYSHYVFDKQAPSEGELPLICHLVQCSADEPPLHVRKDVQDLVKIQFGWDVRKYPLTDYPPQISADGFPYRILNYTINMVQGPAHVEFSYSVDGRSRGVAASVEYSKFCR